jgi:hypothetical protein
MSMMSKWNFLAVSGIAMLLLVTATACGTERSAVTCTQVAPPTYDIAPASILVNLKTVVPLGTVFEVRVACSSSIDWKSLSVDEPGVLQTIVIQSKGGNVFGEFRAVGIGQGVILPVPCHRSPPPLGAAAPGIQGYTVIVQAAK